MQKRLNLRFLAVLLGVFAASAVGTHFLHAYQVKRNAGAYLERATAAENQGRLDQAIDLLARYLALVPNDNDALAHYAVLLTDERVSKSPRARFHGLLVLGKVLAREPQRHDLRRRAVRLAVDLHLYTSARDDLETFLLPAFPADGELEMLMGRCRLATGAYREARTWYERAVEHAPREIEYADLLADLLRRHSADVLRQKETPADLGKTADAVMDEMVQSNASSYRAYLTRARYRRTFSTTANDPKVRQAIASDVAQAQKLAGDEAEVLVAAAEVATDRGDPKAARTLLQRGCQLHPNDWRIYQALAHLELTQKQPEAALTALRDGLKLSPTQVALLWDLADLLVSLNRKDEATDAIARLGREGVSEANQHSFTARLLMGERHWLDAARLLEGAEPLLTTQASQAGDEGSAFQAEQAGLLLGRCYEQLGDADLALAAYRRVVARNSRSVLGRAGEAQALSSLGRLTEALDRYQQLMRLPNAPLSGWIEIARLTLLRNLGRKDADRNWAEVEQALTQAERLRPLPVEVVVLRAEELTARQQLEAACALLLGKYPDPKARPALAWTALAALAGRQHGPAAELALLDEAERTVGDCPDFRLARARHWARRDRAEARAPLAALAKGLERFSPDDQGRILRELAGAETAIGDTAEAERLLTRLTEQQPHDLRCRIALFDLAARAGNDARMNHFVEELHKIEGESGVLWRFARASYLIRLAQRGQRDGLPEARQLLAAVATRRSGWGRVPLCQGLLDDLEGRSDAALVNYLRAIELGERDVLALQRAVELLVARQRIGEAYRLLSRVPDQTLLPQATRQLAEDVALRANDPKRALALAEAVARDKPTDYRAQLRLGRAYLAAGQKDRAEQTLARARDLAPTEPDPWIALVLCLAADGKKDKALAEVDAAQRQLSGGRSALALAECNVLVDRRDQARELYQKALAAAPEDPTTLRHVALFFVRDSKVIEAKQLLRQLGTAPTASPDDRAWARRALALLTGAEGTPVGRAEALKLMEQTDGAAEASSQTVQDQRVRAVLLSAQQTRKSRRAAVQILEQLVAQQVASADDHLLAAQLDDELGDWAKARARYLSCLTLPGGDTPSHLLTSARALLRHGEADEARPLLSRLEAAAPRAFGTAEIKARLLYIQGRHAEAIALLKDQVHVTTAAILPVARLFEELGEQSAAEEEYRQFAVKDRRPEAALALADYFLRRRRFTEALDLCDAAWEKCSPLAVANVCLPALASVTDPKQFERVERHLQAALTKAPDQPELLTALAAIRDIRGQFTEAEDLYRRALARSPDYATALNNLAWLLALEGNHGPEAVKLAEHAIAMGGETPGLLDTRAMAYLALGTPEDIQKAIDDLNVVAQDQPTAVTYYHLARALALAGRKNEAVQSWQNAKALGLRPESLHPLERAAFRRLGKELG